MLDQLSNDVVFGACFTNTGDWLGGGNRFRAGVTFTGGETDAAAYENAHGSRGSLRTLDLQRATNVEVFVENQHDLAGVCSLTTACAAAYATRVNERGFTNPAAAPPFYGPPPSGALLSYDESYFNLAPRLGLLREAGDVQYYAGISGGYEPPSFSEAVTANTAREAQTSNTVEIGSRGSHEFVRWDAGFYCSLVRNELLTITDPLTLVSTTANAGDTIHHGIELGAEVDLLGGDWSVAAIQERLVLRGAYTYGSFRFDDDPTYGDNRIAGLPPHLTRGELVWENRSG